MLDNFKCLFLLSPSEIKQEVCILLILISQRNVWYKVLVVGKNGKLNDTIEASALWSISKLIAPQRRSVSHEDNHIISFYCSTSGYSTCLLHIQ